MAQVAAIVRRKESIAANIRLGKIDRLINSHGRHGSYRSRSAGKLREIPMSKGKSAIALAPDDADLSEAALWQTAGIDSIVIGPGDIAQAHAADEFVDLDELTWFGELVRAFITP